MHFSKLDVWIKAMDLAMDVYQLTHELPKDERFGLCAQLQRAAVSVPSNIAEGEGRRGWRDRSRYYHQARGSLYEVQTQIRLCERLGYVVEIGSLLAQSASVAQLINGTLRRLRDLDRSGRIANSE